MLVPYVRSAFRNSLRPSCRISCIYACVVFVSLSLSLSLPLNSFPAGTSGRGRSMHRASAAVRRRGTAHGRRVTLAGGLRWAASCAGSHPICLLSSGHATLLLCCVGGAASMLAAVGRFFKKSSASSSVASPASSRGQLHGESGPCCSLLRCAANLRAPWAVYARSIGGRDLVVCGIVVAQDVPPLSTGNTRDCCRTILVLHWPAARLAALICRLASAHAPIRHCCALTCAAGEEIGLPRVLSWTQ